MDDKWCSHCRRRIPDPGTSDLHKYAKYWRDNRCYYCDSELTTALSSPSVINGRRPPASSSQNQGIAYNCDICSTTMSSKASGNFLDQNRVLTSPGYWEYICTRTLSGLNENTLGQFLSGISKDTTGFIVCDVCRNMLRQDGQKATEYGLRGYVSSLPSGQIDTRSICMVAGTVWKRIRGEWPSTIPIEEEGYRALIIKRDAYKQQRKWWQFWK